MIEANDILAYASICISTLIGTLYALQTGRISKIELKVDLLTTQISAMNSKHDLLEQKVGFQYTHILEVLEELKRLTVHKENNKEQGFNNMATLLNDAKSEIVKELHATIDSKIKELKKQAE